MIDLEKHYGCKFCDKKSHFAVTMLIHAVKSHKAIPTRTDITTAISDILLNIIEFIEFIIWIILKIILYPFW